MKDTNDSRKGAKEILAETSRTFYIPISHLSARLQDAVTSAYLCMRAIDEIEDHSQLPPETKTNLLRTIGNILQKPFSDKELMNLFQDYTMILPEVTLRLGEWIQLSPSSVAPNILNTTATMSQRMAEWVSKEWSITNEKDLDQYTFDVAGIVGLLLSDLWMWHDEIETDRNFSIAFGRGLQSVNIIRNRAEDLSRGVDFYPNGWTLDDMLSYAHRNLALADLYLKDIKPGEVLNFCKIPLVLAQGTLNAITAGEEKLSRAAVTQLISQAIKE